MIHDEGAKLVGKPASADRHRSFQAAALYYRERFERSLERTRCRACFAGLGYVAKDATASIRETRDESVVDAYDEIRHVGKHLALARGWTIEARSEPVFQSFTSQAFGRCDLVDASFGPFLQSRIGNASREIGDLHERAVAPDRT